MGNLLFWSDEKPLYSWLKTQFPLQNPTHLTIFCYQIVSKVSGMRCDGRLSGLRHLADLPVRVYLLVAGVTHGGDRY